MTAAASRLVLLLAVALTASAAVAASAHAQAVWSPGDTPVFGSAEDTELVFGGAVITCETSSLAGTTGTDSPILDVELEFSGCDISGLGATLICSDLDPWTGDGGMRLVALDPVNDTGTIDLNPGFFCEVTVTGVCSVSIDGPQSDVGALMLDEGTGILTIDIEAAATRSGSSLCGPTSGTAELVEEYDVGPLRIDPAR
jgi:hypothetical protein